MRRSIVAGNWKLNGSRASTRALVDALASGLAAQPVNADVVVCPTYLHLVELSASPVEGLAFGAQNASDQSAGAYTGEVAATMLAEYDCRYVILGHSERRHVYGETDALIAAKFGAVQAAGLIPILCVGELLEEREAGATETVVGRQLDAVIQAHGVGALAASVVAYEPVWAIGTGKTATPEQAQAVHAFIRARVAGHDAGVAEDLRILYGGSVKADNAADLFARADIDGGLIGGAALDAEQFLAICRAAP